MFSETSYFDSHTPGLSAPKKSRSWIADSNGQQNLLVTTSDLTPYLLRISILAYRTHPKFKCNNNTSLSRSGSNVTRSASQNSRSSSASLHRLKNHIRSFSHSGHTLTKWNSAESMNHIHPVESLPLSQTKLPSGAIKCLLLKFERMAPLGVLSDNPRLRTCYFAYYNELLRKDFKESMEIEDLVMMFIDSTEKQLSILAGDSKQLARERDSYCVEFIQLLIEAVNDSSGYMKKIRNSNKPLLLQLQSLKSNLINSSGEYSPADNGRVGSSCNMDSLNIPKVPSFQLRDMPLAKYVGNLLSLTDSETQNQINYIKLQATEKLAISELEAIQAHLRELNEHHIYLSTDFSSEEEFVLWKESEIEAIEKKILSYKDTAQFNTNIFSLPPSPCPDPDSSLFYIPDDARSFYAHLVKLCLQHDLNTARNGGPAEAGEGILSGSSLILLDIVADMWRIPYVTKAMILLDAFIEDLENEEIAIDRLDNVFELAKTSVQQTIWRWAPTYWPYCDKVYFVSILQKLEEIIIKRLGGTLEHIYDQSPPKFGPYLKVIDKHISSYAGLYEKEIEDGESSVEHHFPSEEQIKQLKRILIKTVLQKYDSLVSRIRKDSISVEQISNLAEVLLQIAKRLKKRYDMDLFDRISISKISNKKHFRDFSVDCKSMSKLVIYRMETGQVPKPTLQTVSTLYNNLSEIRDFDSHFRVNVEAYYFPFVLRWAQFSQENIRSWAANALRLEESEKEKEKHANDDRYTGSVTNVFEIFDSTLGVVNKLHWRDDVQSARILTILVKGISDTICEYADRLFDIFSNEIKPKQAQEAESSYFKIAKTLVNGQESIIPYHFLKETWVKLNSIEFAQNRLRKIQLKVKPEEVYECLREAGVPEKLPTSFTFCINIVRAQDVMACDMNGLSDPFVVLTDQNTNEEIARTQVINKTLNPVWNYKFSLPTIGFKSLKAVIWDDNLVQKPQICGTTSIQLDPQEFEDFVSRDFLLDFDTQGRLLANISMECERDDIRFHISKALQTLEKRENDMINLIVEKFTPFIKYALSRQAMKSLIVNESPINKNAIPNWLAKKWLVGDLPSGKRELGEMEIENKLLPLFDYLNANFVTLADSLSADLRTKVLTRTWDVVLNAIEDLLNISLKPKAAEVEIAITWLDIMRVFFHHDGKGPSNEILKSERYWQLVTQLHSI